MNATALLNKILTSYFTNVEPEEYQILSSNIFNGDEGFAAPKDSAAYIIISSGAVKRIGSKTEFSDSDNYEYQYLTNACMFNVDMASRGIFARNYNQLLVTALNSYYSTRVQEDNNIKIFSQSGDMINLSGIDGSASLHKFRLPVIVHTLTETKTPVDSYEEFPLSQEVEN